MSYIWKILEENFIKNGVNVVVCGEERVMNNWNRGYGICKGNNALQMFKDTISIKNHLKVLKLLIKEKTKCYFFCIFTYIEQCFNSFS